jgi:hypothetical protein
MNKKFFAGAIFVLLGLFMITTPSLNFIYAADEQGNSGGDSGGDGGSDSGSNDGGGDNNDGDGGSKDNGDSGDGGETKQGTSNNDEGSKQKQEADDNGEGSSNDAPKADNNGDGEVGQETETKNPEDLKGTPQEQEQAAIDDYINEEPGIKKPYPYVAKEKPKWGPEGIKHIHKCYGEGKDSGCFGGGQGPNDGPTTKGKGDGWGGDGWSKGGDKGHGYGYGHGHYGHHSHGDHDHHHNHNHNYHNDKHHYDHNDNKYYYYYTNDYSNNHATVILQLDYSHSNDYHDVNIEIGNDFDATFDLAGKPENLVITGLDLDSGENFDVCIENDGDVNCAKGHINNQNDVDYVDIRIP